MQGKVALVSGGSRGIGRAVVLALAAQGAKVAAVYVSGEAQMEETLALARQAGGEAFAYRCDVSDFSAAKELIAKVEAELGVPHVLVCNAGIVRDGLLMAMKEEDFTRVLQVNLQGTFNLVRHALPGMLRKRAGRIITISSVVGLKGNAGQANYAAAKAGLIGFTKSVAKEIGGRGITCNAVAPGFIETDMTAALPPQAREVFMAQVPLRRTGTAEEVAAAVSFLASDAAGYITGAVLPVDGGLAM